MNEYKIVGEGYPIVCLHGNGGNYHEFDELTKYLRGYQFILINARYTNKKDPTKKYTYQLLENDVLEVVDSLRLKEYGVIGFSDGGIEAIHLAILDTRVSFIITLGASTYPKAIKPIVYYTFIFQYLFLCILSLYHPVAKRKRKLYSLMLREPHITKDDLNKISVPALVLAGEHDLIKQSDTEFIYHNINHSVLKIIPGGNHFLLGESFKETSREIQLFLKAFVEAHHD